jgi:RNA-directed DNA polymerase
VSYADDFVICCKHSAEQAMAEMRRLMGQIKLTVNETKTHIRQLPQERFDFLGYTFGRTMRHGRDGLTFVHNRRRRAYNA